MEEGQWRPYRVVPTGYPIQWFDGDMNIRFNEENYSVEGGSTVVQNITPPVVSEGIFDTLFELETVRFLDFNPDRVRLTICPNGDCKKNVLNLVDCYKGVGDKKTFMSVDSGEICCCQCQTPVTFTEGVGKVVYDNITYTRCHMCYTTTPWKRNTVVQLCTECDKRNKKSATMAERVCFYCNDSIGMMRKNNAQSLRVRKTRHGKVRTIFLCRNHRIFTPDEKKVYLENEISAMFK
jgi:hypothetical protein